MKRLTPILLRVAALALAAPAAWQVSLLFAAIVQRVAYPYDLEWMEGGVLVHALRLSRGEGIYVAPSVDFIPFLYTPLYPAVLAALGKVFGLGYTLGRAVSGLSVAATIAIATWALAREERGAGPAALGVPRAALWPLAAFSAAGVFAATYPWVEGWYDLVRADAMFLAMVIGGLVWLRAAAQRPGRGWQGLWHPGVLGAGLLLGASFFAKQTGFLFVAAGGAALLAANWRAIPIYALGAGVVGGGGTLIMERATGGWFWRYVFMVHQQHDTNPDRFWRSFGYMLKQQPSVPIAIGVALLLAGVAWAVRRTRPAGSGGLAWFAWCWVVGVLVGAIGWATQWAHFNAYVPAMALGGLAAGAAIVGVAGAARALWPRWRPAGAIAAGVLVGLLGIDLARTRWKVAPLVPTAKDRAAGDKLIASIRAVEGDVFVPFHPWYPVLAGKSAHVHRMGIMDITYTAPPSEKKKPLPPEMRRVAGLAESLRGKRWAVVVLDDRAQLGELPGLNQGYVQTRVLKGDEAPHVVSGARTMPRTWWERKP